MRIGYRDALSTENDRLRFGSRDGPTFLSSRGRVRPSNVLVREKVEMRGIRALGVMGKWFFSTASRVVGIESHGVDPKSADYLFKPPPPEYRP